MFKKFIILLLLAANLSAMNPTNDEREVSSSKWSPTKKIAVFGAIGVGTGAVTLVCAPILFPIGAIVGSKSASAIVAAKIAASTAISGSISAALWAKSSFVAAPLATKISLSISGAYGGKWAKECYYPTPEQELAKLMKEEASEKSFKEQVKEAFKRNQKLHNKKN